MLSDLSNAEPRYQFTVALKKHVDKVEGLQDNPDDVDNVSVASSYPCTSKSNEMLSPSLALTVRTLSLDAVSEVKVRRRMKGKNR